MFGCMWLFYGFHIFIVYFIFIYLYYTQIIQSNLACLLANDAPSEILFQILSLESAAALRSSLELLQVGGGFQRTPYSKRFASLKSPTDSEVLVSLFELFLAISSLRVS